MKRFLTPVLLLAFVTAIFTACINTSRIIATGLEIDITKIERASDGTAAVSWQIKNSNVVPYLFSKINHKIQLNGTALGTIQETEPLPVQPNSNAGRTSKLPSLDAAGSRALADAVTAGSASYRVDTQITILIYDDSIEKSVLSNSGTVSVSAK